MDITKKSTTKKSAPVIADGLSLTFFDPTYESEKNESGFQFLPVKANKISFTDSWQPAKKWDAKGLAFKTSVKKSAGYVKNIGSAYTKLNSNWTKLVAELQVAQIQLSNQGTHNGYSFDSYCKNIGLAISTAYRWLKLAREAKLTSEEKAVLKERQEKAKSDKEFNDAQSIAGTLIDVTKSEHFLHATFQEYFFELEEFKKLVEKHWNVFDKNRKDFMQKREKEIEDNPAGKILHKKPEE